MNIFAFKNGSWTDLSMYNSLSQTRKSFQNEQLLIDKNGLTFWYILT